MLHPYCFNEYGFTCYHSRYDQYLCWSNINYTNLNLSGSAMTSTAAKLNYNDIPTLGVFQFWCRLDAFGHVEYQLLPFLQNSKSYIYRVSDTNGLVIASRTTSASNNKTYPVLNLISTDNPSSFVGGVSATSADLFNINWNDKPSVGFTSQTHRFCFNVGNLQPYKSGFPHTYILATLADVFCINPSGSSPTPSSGCLYLVSDTANKMIFNTNTPYTSSFRTAPLTLTLVMFIS
ncbi:hypothetical protein GN244_ATG00039 [Phytophthora infestans]|uniref:Uncharacterized protein n=1 Tax=Phytophthora infestans TaxID=4787 RepID=A0A833TQU3_PHYIN|nr:hypothetical protein GN244_ATG00039 [Phytophthora infestans]